MCIVQIKYVLGLVWVKEKKSLKIIHMDTEQAYHYWHTSQWISSTKYSLNCCWNHCTTMAVTPSSNPCTQTLNSTTMEPFEMVLFPSFVKVWSWGVSLLFVNSCQSVASTAHDMLCFVWWKLLDHLPCCLYLSSCAFSLLKTVPKGIDLCLMKMSVLWQCSGSICCPGYSLQAESISWWVGCLPQHPWGCF